MTAKERLRKLLGEIKALQDQHKGKPMPKEIGEKIDSMAVEAEGIQAEVDREEKVKALEAKAGKVADPVLPDDDQPVDPGTKAVVSRAAGFMRLGDFLTAQKGLRDWQAAGRQGTFRLGGVKTLFGKRGNRFSPLIQLTPEQVKEFKAIPTIGDDVIQPEHVADFVRVTEHDRLALRDVLNVSRTGSNAVHYTRVTSYGRAAATVAPGVEKPEAEISIDAVTEPVRKIAVWIPVQDEQLEDVPQLRGLIDGELLYDLAKHEEELVMYGDGQGQNFDGLIPNPLVLAMRSEAGDTLIDISRRGITDVRVAGYEPNAIAIDPLDWEAIVLEKGTDERYVWVVVTEGDTMRLWATRVVETVAMRDPDTGARNMVVGDFARGATLWDRQDASIVVGTIDRQLIENMRTILAEERLAFGVTRPGAFRKHETDAGGS